MKQSNRILAYSALALLVMLAAFGAIAFDTSNVAYAQSGTVPVAPTLTAQASGADTINLSWNDVDDAVSYDLWAWDSDTEWQQLGGGTLTGTSYSHSPLTSGTTYYYQIRAFNSDGDPSGWSDRVNEVAGDMVPDEPVLTATAGYQQITVSWPAVDGATRYELWAWLGSWTQVDGGALTATSYVHDGLTVGRTYYFQGRAVNSAGVMSAWSAQVDATVLSAPNIGAPSLTATRGDGQVTLTWSAPSNLAGQTIASYEYRNVTDGGAWTNVGNVLTATVTGLTNGTAYAFEVRAVSTTDARGSMASDSATPSGLPGVPTSFTASATHNSVTLSWGAPAEDGGTQVSSYRIEFLNAQSVWNNSGDSARQPEPATHTARGRDQPSTNTASTPLTQPAKARPPQHPSSPRPTRPEKPGRAAGRYLLRSFISRWRRQG